MSIDSALKRDCEVAVSENATTTKESLEVGNAAKLREVVKCLMDNLNIHLMQPSELITVNRAELDGMVMVCEKALAAPPRNCDMPLVVDGLAYSNADKAWLVFKRNNPDAYFDVPGFLRCIDWLLAPANESEAHQ